MKLRNILHKSDPWADQKCLICTNPHNKITKYLFLMHQRRMSSQLEPRENLAINWLNKTKMNPILDYFTTGRGISSQQTSFPEADNI